MIMKRTEQAIAELGLIQLQSNITPDQTGYWMDLRHDQGKESEFKIERICERQSAEVAAKLRAWLIRWDDTGFMLTGSRLTYEEIARYTREREEREEREKASEQFEVLCPSGGTMRVYRSPSGEWQIVGDSRSIDIPDITAAVATCRQAKETWKALGVPHSIG
jgi:hypothetical protein